MSNIKDLKPSIVWNNFYALTRIPRPSCHEEKVSEFLYNWGVSHGLETKRDEVGNIIIRKPATKGHEHCKTVTMQGHMDMVPAKSSDSKHDFLKDPIEAVVDGEWVRTNGTTLGADNGIGVALAMSVLESDDIQHGPLELLVTVDEEQGMLGTRALTAGAIAGEILLNLDEEQDGELTVGCAGGVNVAGTKKYVPQTEIPEGYTLYRISADKGEGGHSGQDIHLGRINANKSVAIVLHALIEDFGCLLVKMNGGSLRNAIPIVCEADVLVPKLTEKTAIKKVGELIEGILANHKLSDPSAQMTFKAVKSKAVNFVKPSDAKKFIGALVACPHGVERMSDVIPGLTETSTNMALVSIQDGLFSVKSMTRSSIDQSRRLLALRQKAIFDIIGAKTEMDGEYSGWTPNPDSQILKICKESYRKLTGKDPVITATHGGLECGILLSKFPGMDAISFGPTIKYPHSPAEKLHIPTVARAWEFLKVILTNIPQK